MVVADEKGNTFIVKKNGDKVYGKKITRPSAMNPDQIWIKLDGQKFDNDDLEGYQDANGFYALFDRHGTNTWVKQLKRGAINLYTYETYAVPGSMQGSPSSQNHDHYVFEKASTGLELAELSIPDIASILKDNKRAYDTFTAQFGSIDKKILPKQLENHPQVLFDAVDIYNGNK